jgi:hypothetical protein
LRAAEIAPGPAFSSGSKLQLPEAGAEVLVGVVTHEGEFSVALAESFTCSFVGAEGIISANPKLGKLQKTIAMLAKNFFIL